MTTKHLPHLPIVDPVPYHIRKAERYCISLTYYDVKRESDFKMTNCHFIGLPQTDDCVFSLTERDDGKGFGVEMSGLIIVPSTYLCFRSMPKWLAWIAFKLGER